MRIVNKQQFYNLPKGTICAKYEPCIFGEPFVKGDTWCSENGTPYDYLYTPLWGMVQATDSYEEANILSKAEKTGESFKMDYCCTMRDGLFDEDQKYVVWEEEDMNGLFNLFIIRFNI